MENKEVERTLKNSFDMGNCYVKESISIAFTYIEQLEKENVELKQRLAAKDKALDKMIDTISVPYCPPKAETPERIKCHTCEDTDCAKCWKEWSENDT